MVPGIFLNRPNRFIAHICIDGTEEICHVKNTGRCKELLLPGAQVWCQHFDSPTRKTKYDLIAVQKGNRLINMDSQAPNAAAKQWLLDGGLGDITDLRSEVFHGIPGSTFPLRKTARLVFLKSKVSHWKPTMFVHFLMRLQPGA